MVLSITAKARAWPASFAGPALIAVAQPVTDCGPASSGAWTSMPLVNDGASLTAVTVTWSAWVALASVPPLAVPPSSVMRTWTVAVPLASAAGV